jgi:hypothetical protein
MLLLVLVLLAEAALRAEFSDLICKLWPHYHQSLSQ